MCSQHGTWRIFTDEVPYFEFWNSISGVLAFETYASFERIAWQYQFYTNPYATIRLPPAVVRRFREGKLNIGFDLKTK